MAETNDFRRRRLSLPLSKQMDDGTVTDTSFRKRRLSLTSNSKGSHAIVSPSPKKKKPTITTAMRVLHAAELDGPEPASAIGGPRWKRRLTLDLVSDADKLPFPPDIVGTFSYHGIEPAYEDETDEEDEAPPQCKESHHKEMSPSFQQFLPQDNSSSDSSSDPIPNIMPSPSESVAKINQDRGGVAYPYHHSNRSVLFSVYDGHGHGGELVSQFALAEIQQRLCQHTLFPHNMEKAFSETFQAVDSALAREPLIQPMFAGSTACVCLRVQNQLHCANLGDSRAVMARRQENKTYIAVDLTQDQNPDVPAEQARIEAAGGFVTPPPGPGLSARVWLDEDCTQVGLAMARSIGDHAAATVGVISDPVTTQHEILPEDEVLILATDGVWEFISSQQAVEIVQEALQETHGSATKACQALIRAAAQRWREEEGSYRDDITAIVVKLQCLWEDDHNESAVEE